MKARDDTFWMMFVFGMGILGVFWSAYLVCWVGLEWSMGRNPFYHSDKHGVMTPPPVVTPQQYYEREKKLPDHE